MVPYTMIPEKRVKVDVVLVGFSIAASALIAKYLSVSAGWIAPSVFGIFIALRWVVNKHLWRWRAVKYLIGIPCLADKWTGHMTYIDKGGSDKIRLECDLLITQTWTEINLNVVTNKTQSKTLVAGIIVSDSEVEVRFSYEWSPTVVKMTPFGGRGYNTLTLDGDDRLHGHFFSNSIDSGYMDVKRRKKPRRRQRRARATE